MKSVIIVLTAAALIFPGCTQKKTPVPTGKGEQTMEESKEGISRDAEDTVMTESGLKYVDLKLGTGATPQQGQTCVMHYTGWLTNGTKFESSKDKGEPFPFVLGQHRVIKGWEEGVATMKVGGIRKLIIPPELGWGDRGTGGGLIPPNATVIFDVELLEVK